MQRAHRRSRAAFNGLVIMLIALAVFATAAAFTTKTAADRAVASAGAVAALGQTADLVLTITAIVSAASLLLLALALLVLGRADDEASAATAAELKRLKQASLTDYLTGLGNHRAYQDDLIRNVAECWSDGSVMTIALVDVDGLRAVNDRSGYLGGDRLLSTLAGVLRTADLQSIPYRLGGDEFALAFAGMPAAVARTRMEQVRAAVEGQLGGATVSIGLATMSLGEPDLLVVREQAAAALDEAKRRGRNTVVAFDEIRGALPMFAPARVAAVRALISSADVDVAFQPIWDTANDRVIGYEALARPGGDPPIDARDAFSIAERIGRAHDLDRVCRDAITAQAATLPPGALLFMNVSPHSLDRDELDGSALVRTLAAAGLKPDAVVLEIPASSTAPLDMVVREAARLRRLGFRLALDNTGAAQSGLEILSRLVVDYVKIDRDVVVRALDGAGGRGILAGIIAIAHEMRATIIAEGIESSEMLDVVRDATRSVTADTAAQGYYLGRPLPRFVDAAEAELAGTRVRGGAAAVRAQG